MNDVPGLILSSIPLAWLVAGGVAWSAGRAGLPRLPRWSCLAAAAWSGGAAAWLMSTARGGSDPSGASAVWFRWLDGPLPAVPRIDIALQAGGANLAFAIAMSAGVVAFVCRPRRGVMDVEAETARVCVASSMVAFTGLVAVLAANVTTLLTFAGLTLYVVVRATVRRSPESEGRGDAPRDVRSGFALRRGEASWRTTILPTRPDGSGDPSYAAPVVVRVMASLLAATARPIRSLAAVVSALDRWICERAIPGIPRAIQRGVSAAQSHLDSEPTGFAIVAALLAAAILAIALTIG